MDSRLIAGAYSKRYKYVERDEIENLKNRYNSDGNHVLAKARRLSQETNKRRKKAEIKLKQEQAREEKRRQEILNKRHQEQKNATEKFQRSHMSTGHRHSPRRYDQGGGHLQLEEALRLVRGESLEELTHDALQRTHNNDNSQDTLNISYNTKTSHGEQGSNSLSKHHNRSRNRYHHPGTSSKGMPLSGLTLDTSLRAELIERSMHNLSTGRNRFEQQLEQHQQLLVEQQQKSMKEFNQAIRREIDADTKVAGTEDNDERNCIVTEGRACVNNDDASLHSDSSCTTDSLDGEKSSSLNNSTQSQSQLHQALRETHQEILQQNDRRQDLHDNASMGFSNPDLSVTTDRQQGPQSRAVRPQSSRVQAPYAPPQQQQQGQHVGPHQSGPGHSQAFLAGGSGINNHVVGPIPQGYYTPQASGIPSSTAPFIQGNNTSYHHDSVEAPSTAERRVTIGTALRLPQRSSEPPKQPAPPLQYNSQLLVSRKFEPLPSASAAPFSKQDSTGFLDPKSCNLVAAEKHLTTALTQNELPSERPKAHVYAWASPPPAEGEQITVPYSNGMTNIKPHVSNQETSMPFGYSASVAADRVMATNLHPTTTRTISTAATTTCVYQTVDSAHNQEPLYSHANNSNAYFSQANNNNVHSLGGMAQPLTAYFVVPPGQGSNPRTTHSSVRPMSGTCLGISSAAPSSFTNYQAATDGTQQCPHSNGSANCFQHQSDSISQRTLGQANGQRTTIYTEGSELNRKIVLVEDRSDSHQKEVKGILKKADKDAGPKPESAGHTKFNVQDSVEIAKKQFHSAAELRVQKKSRKKGVRFADLQYTFPNEDSGAREEDPDITSVASAKPEETSQQQTPLRPRLASARVLSSAARPADSKVKGPRIASAGPSCNPPAARPKAAAHIIMTVDTSNQNDGQYPNPSIHIAHGSHGHYETGGPGILVHKSQLEKKVVMINNNFMSRVPVYSSAATSNFNTPAAATTVYTITDGAANARNGTMTATPAHPVSAASINGGAVRTLTATTQADQGGGRWTGKASYTTNPGSTTNASTAATTLPSHSHFSNHISGGGKAVFSETGLRIDRTPTDDEINNLWKNMRSMLDVSESKAGQHQQPTANNTSESTSRQQVHLSQQYIDGTSLGMLNGITRVASGYSTTQLPASTLPATGVPMGKQVTQGKNGYLHRFSLLQQRRNSSTGSGTVGHKGSGPVEQRVLPVAFNGNPPDSQYGAVNVSYAPREEMSESLAEFVAAEQMVQTQGTDVRDSRVAAAMQSAQAQQQMYNSVRQKLARAGPTALSMEEHRLLESLDKLNERLKVVDSKTAKINQRTNVSEAAPKQQIHAHGSGFRGHILTSTRQYTGGLKSMGRPVSARLLMRPYH